jgi:hypothetical protein
MLVCLNRGIDISRAENTTSALVAAGRDQTDDINAMEVVRVRACEAATPISSGERHEA